MKTKRPFSPRLLALFLSVLLLLSPTALSAASAPEELAFARGSFALSVAAKTDLTSMRLIPGGMPFGIRMQTEGVMVVGLTEVTSNGKSCRPAYEAGVRQKDILVAVGGKTVADAEEATALIAASGGKPVTLSILRGSEKKELTVTPKKSDKDGQFRCGLWLRDSASGIGTVTFVDPDNGLFGGLGHGVCDSDTGALVPLSRGSVLSVKLSGAVRGECGKPGELRGSFTGTRLGSVVTNSECGVFGVLTEAPQSAYAPMPVAAASEVKEGCATVLCTLDESGIKEYAVEISNIDHSARPTKSFTVRVTDPALLQKTGGIVQGMSGSPIIQNGKIVGAVTHVLVDDPTTGYGIFVENMLVNMPLMAR